MTYFLIALLVVGASGSDGPKDALEKTARSYDTARALHLATSLDAAQTPGQEMLRARAWLLVAEFRRLEYEGLDRSKTAERRALGKEIDEAARHGISALDPLEPGSEKFRINAELLGTTIRSDYRAGKYKGEMRALIEKAIALDPENARAHVAHAKFWILRPNPDADELSKGLACLETALTLDQHLESALLLQAYALERLGEPTRARALYRRCLEKNPTCTPASDALQRLETGPASADLNAPD